MKNLIIAILILSLGLNAIKSQAAPQPIGSAFSYQGILMDSGSPANGNYDIGFELFTTETGNLTLLTDEYLSVPVIDGQFNLPQVDFGDAVFAAGTEIWINLYITKTGSGLPYVELSPRQRLNAVPYAVQAEFLAANGANTNDVLQFDGSNWVASAVNSISPWIDAGSSVSYSGSVGIGISSPTDKLHITTTLTGQNPIRAQVNGQTKFKVENNGSTTIGTNFTSTPVNGLYVHGDVKGGIQSNGLMKYMVAAYCGGTNTNIQRQYNGTSFAGSATITNGGSGDCQITFPTTVNNRFILATAKSDMGGRTLNCSFLSTNSVRCLRFRTTNGSFENGNIDVFIF